MKKGLSQRKDFFKNKYKNKDIWYIDEGGKNTESIVIDAKEQIINSAFPWFEQFNDLNDVFEILKSDDQEMDTLWGFGRNPSPIRSYMCGYVALSLGKTELAVSYLAEAISSDCFQSLFSTIDEAKSRAL